MPNTGPWFCIDISGGPTIRSYRGESSMADVPSLLGFAGHMCIELDPARSTNNLSVYREIIGAARIMVFTIMDCGA